MGPDISIAEKCNRNQCLYGEIWDRLDRFVEELDAFSGIGIDGRPTTIHHAFNINAAQAAWSRLCTPVWREMHDSILGPPKDEIDAR